MGHILHLKYVYKCMLFVEIRTDTKNIYIIQRHICLME